MLLRGAKVLLCLVLEHPQAVNCLLNFRLVLKPKTEEAKKYQVVRLLFSYCMHAGRSREATASAS